MLNTALAGSDPVIFFESQRLYDIGELFEKEVLLSTMKFLSVFLLREEQEKILL